MEKIKVVIVDDCKEARDNIKMLLSFEEKMEVVGEAENGLDAISIVQKKCPHIVLMDINMPKMDGIKASEEISLKMPETSIVIMSVQGEQEYLKKAMSAGARAFLTKPFSTEELINSIINTYEMEAKRKQNILAPKNFTKMEPKIITVFSTKGGVGKTTIASNLAVGIARQTRTKVAILDLDLQFGDVAIVLNVTVKNTINDLVNECQQMDKDTVNDFMATHLSGVRVLPAPTKPEYAEYITSLHIEKILKALKETYNYIIIDTSASFHETVLTSLDMSDMILFVSVLEVPAIKNTKSGLDILESLHYPKGKIRIVLNKAQEHFGVKYKDFEDTLKCHIWAYIPEDSQTVVTSLNKGLPFVMTRTETRAGQAMQDIVKKVVEGEKEAIEIIDVKDTKSAKDSGGFSLKKIFG